ncbi:MAG TPA: hypothetical protein PLZ95_08165, partial [Bryobacteraceae bacterium]|nr:hypothetical protein [Bryobacteraceae bacterium]
LEADARLYRRYVYQPGEPLSLPIVAYRGASDPNVGEQHTTRWAEMTTGKFAERVFAGGHFYLDESRDDLIAAIRDDLTRA